MQGKLLILLFPHVGNVGTNKEDHRSDKIWAKGVIFNTEVTQIQVIIVL